MDDQTQGKRTVKRLLLLAATLAVGATVWYMLGDSDGATAAEPVAPVPRENVLARVNGEPITEQAVEEAVAGQLVKMRRERHELIERAVENEVRNRLLDAAAEERGMARDELVKAEVEERAARVPEAQVDAFYEARKSQIRAPKEQVEGQIRQAIAYEALIESLESSAEIEVLTEPFRVDVDASGPAKGPDHAPVTIVEFSDFECPYCARVTPAIERVAETYGEEVRIVFRQFPLDFHPNARKAAEASLCAAEQGKFWEMHDRMFADQKNLGIGGLKAIAAGLPGLDAEAFATCLDTGRHVATVEDDLRDGARAGVASTPAFFVNGRLLSGAQSFETFSEVIDDELKRKASS